VYAKSKFADDCRSAENQQQDGLHGIASFFSFWWAAAELHRTARQRKRNRQCSLSETAVTELHRALSRGFLSQLVTQTHPNYAVIRSPQSVSIKAKNEVFVNGYDAATSFWSSQ